MTELLRGLLIVIGICGGIGLLLGVITGFDWTLLSDDEGDQR